MLSWKESDYWTARVENNNHLSYDDELRANARLLEEAKDKYGYNSEKAKDVEYIVNHKSNHTRTY